MGEYYEQSQRNHINTKYISQDSSEERWLRPLYGRGHWGNQGEKL